MIKLLENISGTRATLTMLCKTATARKVLKHAWNNSFDIHDSSIHVVDAKKHFGVSVDACLFVTRTGAKNRRKVATIFADLSYNNRIARVGIINGELVGGINSCDELMNIDGIEYKRWRSGVKHDAAMIMEFIRNGQMYRNGLGENRDLEPTCLYPLLKSLDLANNRLSPGKLLLPTQRSMTDDTAIIKIVAPKTWQYLINHYNYLDRWKSGIYINRPRFSIFGVAEYTFAPWKVAISGLYKNIKFRVIGNIDEKLIVVDDTCYFIPCEYKEEALFFSFFLEFRNFKAVY